MKSMFFKAISVVLFSGLALNVQAKVRGHQELVDNSCELLSEQLAISYLNQAVRPGVQEHIPTFYSQCGYIGTDKGGFKTIFVTKFFPEEMLDYDNLSPAQLDFNVSFMNNGGEPHAEKEPFPGEATYVFHDRHLTIVFMIPGITGPLDGAGLPTRLGVSFQLVNPDMTPDARRDLLIKQAWQYFGKLLKQNKTAP
ncbi:hypothetical protein Q7C_663 [Methylophaga frappieri]|uniref:Uncharacterized protein n=1 Tax=Methylophaga frappieri (strain ATCC BAA-2434 / DSM 25690 / JAM7) TaxID=754477 RepID=I1YFZ1_METFJ|nr:hypothetical protein [Methylophaga frappieri]AFJ01834.1 hypothetical protein Q7C_663 [Methylophaga frappieri]